MALSLKPLNPDLYPPGLFLIPEESGVLRVGREAGNDLMVCESSVSASHAKILIDPDAGVDVEDCESSNGTFVNGIRVGRTRLSAGDLVRFATAEFRVTFDSAVAMNGAIGKNGSSVEGDASGNGHGGKAIEPPGSHSGENGNRTEIEGLRLENERLADKVSEWESHIAIREAELAALSAKMREQEQSAQALLSERVQEIANISEQLRERESSLRALVGERDAEIADLKSRVTEQNIATEALVARQKEEVEALSVRLKEGESERQVLVSAHKTEVASLYGKLRSEEKSKRELLVRHEERETALGASVKEREEEIRRLDRELGESVERESRSQSQLSETRRTLMEREGAIAALQYELSQREGSLRNLGEQHEGLHDAYEKVVADLAELRRKFEENERQIQATEAARDEALASSAGVLDRLRGFGDRLVLDWKFWFEGDSETGSEGDADSVFSVIEKGADRIREELDRIEPIWGELGAKVQDELSRRCEQLRIESAEITAELDRRRFDLAETTGNLEQLRELVDREVRRAQGLSRRGTAIEIPERFESMVIARDREQAIYGSIIDRVEDLDRILGACPGSRKFRGVVAGLRELRGRLAEVLEGNGVNAFEVPVGTELTLKHRKEVQILCRKGWGTSRYSEYPFQPGEVVKLVRPGYRAGDVESGVVLRKAEVMIRGVED